jgi:DNA-binding response OmpR family regulator
MADEKRPRVLIVEDEPDMNNLLAEVLSAYGFTPEQAGDAEQALAHLAARTPDAILLDLMLPGLSGLELCRQLKTSRATRTIPIVILTALDRAADRRHGYETGADDYVTKPFTPEGLVTRLQVCLDQCRDARASCGHLTRTLDLTASLADLKMINALATCLYCHTDLPVEQIEALRGGLVAIADAAGQWAVQRRGTSPARMTVDMTGERLQLRFQAIAEGGEAFLAQHLDAEAAVPASFTDAGIIDRVRRDGAEVVIEKAIPPVGPMV